MKKDERMAGCEKPSAYYRRHRPELFSDSEIRYEIPLTEQLFDVQMQLLSTKKMQSEFERFVIGVASRLITPNIKPQTGPDGGGDGKVDAETYAVSDDVADKWIQMGIVARGKEKWAFAISCKKQWKSKVEGDVAKAVETKRGYTRVLFFSNQNIKASTRLDVEQGLSKKYGVEVSIFDGTWCWQSVKIHGCLDIALAELGFDDQYKKKRVETIGPHDRQRKKRLEEIEKSILRHVEGLDTGYVDELEEACLLSRGLENPRWQTEGFFSRAMRECKAHGSRQQLFNLIYDHAWTSYFWFEDVEATYQDCLKLKAYLKDDFTVARLEKLTNLVTVLSEAARQGLIDSFKVGEEAKYIAALEEPLSKDPERRSCYLFLRIYLIERNIIRKMVMRESISDELREIRPLLLEVPSRLDISFESLYDVMEMLSKQIGDNEEFDDLVDALSEKLSTVQSQVNGAKVRLSRADSHFENGHWKAAVRHLSFCIHAFEKEECMDELILSSAQMGLSLWEMRLPYSAEAFLVKAVFFLWQNFRSTGVIRHELFTILWQLCEIELMLGRFVMYLGWYRLMMMVSVNGGFGQEKGVAERNTIIEGAWLCRFAVCNLGDPIIALLPDILDRMGMHFCADYLKFALGYAESLPEECKTFFQQSCCEEKMSKQPVFGQFLGDLNIASTGDVNLHTSINNFTFTVDYANDRDFQLIAEAVLAAMESLMATCGEFDVLVLHSHITIHLLLTDETSEVCPRLEIDQYEFKINKQTFTEQILADGIAKLVAYMFARNMVVLDDAGRKISEWQKNEKVLDRVYSMPQVRMLKEGVLGREFKYRIQDWVEPRDKVYVHRGAARTVPSIKYCNRVQNNIETFLVNQDISLWGGAGWKGCFFLSDLFSPPVFGLIFADAKKGQAIVDEWRSAQEAGRPSVKILLVKGINAEHLCWYRVGIIPDGLLAEKNNGRFVSAFSQRHTMTPMTSKNLDFFEKEYDRFGVCRVVAVSICKDGRVCVPSEEKSLVKFDKIEIRNAYEIRQGEDAMFVLGPDDNPFIPAEYKTNAPVLKALERIRMASRSGRGYDFNGV